MTKPPSLQVHPPLAQRVAPRVVSSPTTPAPQRRQCRPAASCNRSRRSEWPHGWSPRRPRQHSCSRHQRTPRHRHGPPAALCHRRRRSEWPHGWSPRLRRLHNCSAHPRATLSRACPATASVALHAEALQQLRIGNASGLHPPLPVSASRTPPRMEMSMIAASRTMQQGGGDCAPAATQSPGLPN